MKNMFLAGIFFFSVGLTGIEHGVWVSDFFAAPARLGSLAFGAMTMYGGALLSLYAFFLPIRIKEEF